MTHSSRDIDPLSEGNLAQCLDFLHALHPHLDTAEAVCCHVYRDDLTPKKASQMPPSVGGRPGALGDLQKLCLEVSLDWEHDQESGTCRLQPVYRPDAKVMQVRFIANFARQHMFRKTSYHLAVAVGACLHTYNPDDARRMAHLEEDENIRRKKPDVHKGIQQRFGPVHGVIPMQPPQSCLQRQLLYEMLRVFVPWEHDCLANNEWIDVETIEPPDWDRKHAILCAGLTGCAGWDTLATQYIEDIEEAKGRAAADGTPFPDRVPRPPQHSIEIPMFPPTRFPPYDPHREQFPDNNPEVTGKQLQALRAKIEAARRQAQHRRLTNTFSRLFVAVDGRDYAQFTPEEGSTQPLRVSAYAVSLTLAGDDAAGRVPLARFDLPDPDAEGHLTQLMTVIPDSGATITLTLSPLRDEASVTAWEVTVRWVPEAMVYKDLDWYDALLGRILNEQDLIRMLGSTPLHQELGEASQLRLEEIYHGVCHWPASEGRRAVLLAHLGDLFHCWHQPERAQACWEAGVALAQTAADTPRSPAVEETPAAGAGPSAPPTMRPTAAREPGSPQEEGTPPRHLRLLTTRGPGTAPVPSALWAGGSTEMLTDFVRPYGLAASTEKASRSRVYPSQDGRAKATFRALPHGQIAVTIETRDEQLAHRRWGFRFARQDDTELFSGDMALQPVPKKPGRWEGRDVKDWIFTEPYTFHFYVLPSDAGDTL